MALSTRATITSLDSASGFAGLSVVMHGWTGWVPSIQESGDRFRRAGQRGSGMQSTGSEGAQVACTAWRAEVSEAAAIETARVVEALKLRTCSLVFAGLLARTIPRVRVHESAAVPVPARGLVSTAVSTHVVLIRFTVERLPDA